MTIKAAISGGLALLATGPALGQIQGQFTPTGFMKTPRWYSALVPIAGGNVLAVGGSPAFSGTLATAEIYNARKATWTPTGSLTAAREEFATATLANGKVLVAGGADGAGGIVGTAELYDLKTGTWSAAGTLVVPRVLGTASRLADGRVLLAGGCTGSPCATYAAQSEIYDPATNGWTGTGSLKVPRILQSQVSLGTGKVLIVGGTTATGVTATAELFDPASGTWNLAAPMNVARMQHGTSVLPDGKVLVSGGVQVKYPLGSAELYDPAADAWTMTGGLASARYGHASITLADGTVLLAGGYGRSISCGRGCIGYIPFANAEVFDEVSGGFTATAALPRALAYPMAALAGPGVALIAGGEGTTTTCCVVVPDASLYTPLTLSISSYALAFGFLQVGLTAPAQTVNVTNVSRRAVAIGSIATTGDYAQTNTCPATLPPGQGCAISVSFAPTAMGARNGTLTLTDNSPGSPKQSIALSGTGETLALGFSPAGLVFPNVAVGSLAQLSATLINAGAAPVSIGAVTIAPGGKTYAQTNDCPALLAVQQSCTVQVTFTPPDVFKYAAKLSVANGAGAAAVLPLVGHGANN